MNIKESILGPFRGFLSFLQQCRRVLLVATKPGREEFETSIKITGIGIIIIGVIGFLLFMAFQLIGFS